MDPTKEHEQFKLSTHASMFDTIILKKFASCWQSEPVEQQCSALILYNIYVILNYVSSSNNVIVLN